MDAATFETLVARSEKLAARRPRQYRWGQMYDAANAHALTHRIRQEVQLPGDALIVNIEGSNRRFDDRLRHVKGSRIL
jgi:hypothetical protein